MTEIKVVSAKLFLKNPFHIAHGSYDFRENVFLQITKEGKRAYGEAPVVPYYGVTKEQIQADLMMHCTKNMINQYQNLEVLKQFEYSMSACAFSNAIYDLHIQETSSSIQNKHYGTKKSSFTIAYSNDLHTMLENIRTCGFSTIKLKAGFPDDVERVQKIRQQFPHLRIRLDANQGWTFGQACAIINQLQDLEIELIEEPITGTPEQLYRLTQISTIPILLDETIQNAEDLNIYKDCIAGIVVKLAKSGGMQAARILIEKAQSHGLDVMLSSMVESSLGIVQALPLVSLCRWIDLDAPQLLSNDVFSGLSYTDEMPALSSTALFPTEALMEKFSQAEALVLE